MNILAIETTVPQGTLAVLKDGAATESAFSNGFPHSMGILAAIKELFERTDIRPQDLSSIIVDAGTGSFTGIRLGISVAIGIAMPYNIKIFGASSASVIAYRVLREHGAHGTLAVLQDAKTDQAYITIFEAQKNMLRIIENTKITDVSKLGTVIPEEALVCGCVPFFKPGRDTSKRFSFIEEPPVPSAAAALGLFSEWPHLLDQNHEPIYIKSPVKT